MQSQGNIRAAVISIHAPRAGCDTSRSFSPRQTVQFQSTHPVRGATEPRFWRFSGHGISIHAPRAGCDAPPVGGGRSSRVFQSTHPVRGATSAGNNKVASVPISIHAPRAGCDASAGSIRRQRALYFNPRTPCGVRRRISRAMFLVERISIHAPRAGCDSIAPFVSAPIFTFQSTHPVRGATVCVHGCGRRLRDISIHAPRAGCDLVLRCRARRRCISIHAPRAGCDGICAAADPKAPDISIHAPRAGCDYNVSINRACYCRFQSTHPVRGATNVFQAITAHTVDFNPRTPCGVRRLCCTCHCLYLLISIHAPRAGCDKYHAGSHKD